MASSTVENYLKQLYLELRSSGSQSLPIGRLATAMAVVPGTATSMVKALSRAGLVKYEPRGGVALTPAGEQLALHVLRRHRLLELFLVKVLGMDWSIVHAEADTLEHAISEAVLERIDALLGHPQTDPHGDPIPTSTGQVRETPTRSLADCRLDAPWQIAQVSDQSPEFLRFLERQGLMPGLTVIVESREPHADLVKLLLPGGTSLALGLASAAKVLVEPPSPAPKRPTRPRERK